MATKLVDAIFSFQVEGKVYNVYFRMEVHQYQISTGEDESIVKIVHQDKFKPTLITADFAKSLLHTYLGIKS